MPRNPDKTRCCYPTCKNWAMHGRAFCRAHCQLDPDSKIEKAKGGAPRNNLNALKTGRYARSASPPDLAQLAGHLIHRPDKFPLAIGLAIQSIHQRTQDPLLRILSLLRLVQDLVPQVTKQLIKIEVKNLLRLMPPAKQASTGRIIQKHCIHLNPLEQLRFIRSIARDLFPEKEKKQPTEPEQGNFMSTIESDKTIDSWSD